MVRWPPVSFSLFFGLFGGPLVLFPFFFGLFGGPLVLFPTFWLAAPLKFGPSPKKGFHFLFFQGH